MLMVRYLVTGASGFIGSNFIGYLKQHVPNAEIIGISKGKCEIVGIEYVDLDLASNYAIDKIKELAPDRIFHLAGAPKARDWQTLLSSNVATTINVLEAGMEIKGVKIFVIGSAAEYGLPKKLPVSEEMKPMPITRYALSMVCRRIVVEGFAARCQVATGILFNPIGPGVGKGSAPGAFIEQLERVRAGEIAKMMVGDLTMERDFIDIEDACRAFIAICEKGKTGESYNICSGVSHTIRELLEILMKKKGVKAKIITDQSRIDKNEIKKIYGSYEKIKMDTGWIPKISFEESVSRMCKG